MGGERLGWLGMQSPSLGRDFSRTWLLCFSGFQVKPQFLSLGFNYSCYTIPCINSLDFLCHYLNLINLDMARLCYLKVLGFQGNMNLYASPSMLPTSLSFGLLSFPTRNAGDQVCNCEAISGTGSLAG